MTTEERVKAALTVAENWGVYFRHPPCENDPYNCDCQDCADERDLDRARRTPEGETL